MTRFWTVAGDGSTWQEWCGARRRPRRGLSSWFGRN